MKQHRYAVYKFIRTRPIGTGKREYVATILAENVPHAQLIAWKRWPELAASAEYPRGRAVIRATRKSKA